MSLVDDDEHESIDHYCEFLWDVEKFEGVGWLPEPDNNREVFVVNGWQIGSINKGEPFEYQRPHGSLEVIQEADAWLECCHEPLCEGHGVDEAKQLVEEFFEHWLLGVIKSRGS